MVLRGKFILLVFAFVINGHAKAEKVLEFKMGKNSYQIERIASGYGIIWGLSFLDRDNLIFSEKSGKIHNLDLVQGTATPLKNPPVSSLRGQGGLLDLAVSKLATAPNRVYATYTKKVGQKYTTALAFAQLKGLKFSRWSELFVAKPAFSEGYHFGSRIAFDNKGYIYLGVGDRGHRKKAQDLDSHNGKIIRLSPDGSIPEDNPFVAHPGAKKEIWTLGHRNPQGLFFDLETNGLFESEHGPQGGDEINILTKGDNFGWPIVSHGKEYGSGATIGEGTSKVGMKDPLKYYIPSIAPGALLLYRGLKLKDFNGYLVSTSLAFGHLNLVKLSKPSLREIKVASELNERIRDVIQGPDEFIYFSTDNGNIYRILSQ